jgi:hypothetical protein
MFAFVGSRRRSASNPNPFTPAIVGWPNASVPPDVAATDRAAAGDATAAVRPTTGRIPASRSAAVLRIESRSAAGGRRGTAPFESATKRVMPPASATASAAMARPRRTRRVRAISIPPRPKIPKHRKASPSMASSG